MTSIAASTSSPTSWDRSKPVSLPADFYAAKAEDGGHARWLAADASGTPLVPDNRPDNVWGRITLPSGETVTIYNKGGTESENPLDIDWTIDGEAARADAIMAKYGGVLEIADTADPDAPTFVPDGATLLSRIMESPTLVQRMLGSGESQLLPDDPLLKTGDQSY